MTITWRRARRSYAQGTAAAHISGDQVAALAIDTTGSSVIPVDAKMQPQMNIICGADHRSWREAALITETAHRKKLQAIDWCGGTYSSNGFFQAAALAAPHPEKRERLPAAFEHCDMVAAVLSGIDNPAKAPRSICAMGHKWCGTIRWEACRLKTFWSQWTRC